HDSRVIGFGLAQILGSRRGINADQRRSARGQSYLVLGQIRLLRVELIDSVAVRNVLLTHHTESCADSCRRGTNIGAGAVRQRVSQAAQSAERTAIAVGKERASGNVDLYAKRISDRDRVHGAIAVVRIAGR